MDVHSSFQTEKQLERYLTSKSIPIGTWGRFRTVSHLFQELINHESYLTEDDGKVIRHVDVIGLVIKYSGRYLLQYRQVFVSGECRDQIKLPSEKMRRGESQLETCARLLREELGILATTNFKHLKGKEEIIPALAYPGLLNLLKIHYYETDLPKEFAVKSEYQETTAKQTTYFKWFDKLIGF